MENKKEVVYEEKIIRGGQYGVALLIFSVAMLVVGVAAFVGGCIWAAGADSVQGIALIVVGAVLATVALVIMSGLLFCQPVLHGSQSDIERAAGSCGGERGKWRHRAEIEEKGRQCLR